MTWTDIKPFNRSNTPYQDMGATFFESSAALTGTTSIVVDFTDGLTTHLNSKTLVTKGEFYNALKLNAAFPLMLGIQLGTFTGNTGSSALPKLDINTESTPNELLTGNPRIQASSSVDYLNDSTQSILFGLNKSPMDFSKLGVIFTLPAGVSLSSLKLFLAKYESGSFVGNL